MRTRSPGMLMLGIAGTLLLAACGSSTTTATSTAASTPPASSASSPASSAAAVSGEITVLTNRTDLVQNGTFDGYAKKFNVDYPDVKVKFEAITDYEGEVKIRMNTDKYGDVLLIPNALSVADYPKYFSSLGSLDDLKSKYRFVANAAVGGQVYGVAQNGNANGYVYNKAVWTAAGITTAPKTPEEFVADMQAIKSKTSAIPYYTNYKDGWPLTKWTDALGTVSCNGDAKNKLATDQAPWAAGQDLGVADSLLFTLVNKKLTEPDPTTTNWENSKTLLGSGKVATMWLGSWAVTQMQDAAVKAGKKAEDIGFWPFPQQVGGAYCAMTFADYLQAINKNSPNQAAAKAWIDWFTDKSGFATAQGSIPTALDGAMPATLADFTALGVKYVELAPAPADQVGLVDKIDNAAEIGLYKPDYKQKLVDIARGAAPGSLDSFLKDLNQKWSDGITAAGS
jgi:raffinose/stachyose/melibiose transport system substrate-binding protein